jgi:protein-disulfide isomerase
MPMRALPRLLCALAFALTALGLGGQAFAAHRAAPHHAAPPAASGAEDMSLGNPNAKVTVIEYASVACPVCGHWYREVFPAFKAKYIDTGKVRFVTREMLVGDDTEVAIASTGFLMARCAGRDKYFKVTDAIYTQQAQVYQQPRQTLLGIAKSVGLSEAQFNACVSDQTALAALNARVETYATHYFIQSTPTFVINGKVMEAGYHTLPELDAVIAAAQSAK